MGDTRYCRDMAVPTVCCGDLSCEGQETANNCAVDCVSTAYPTPLPTLAPSAVPTLSPTMSPTTPLDTALFRINCGGGAFTDSSGNAWSADQYFLKGPLLLPLLPPSAVALTARWVAVCRRTLAERLAHCWRRRPQPDVQLEPLLQVGWP